MTGMKQAKPPEQPIKMAVMNKTKELLWPEKKNKQKKNTTTIEISGGWNVMENVDFTSDILSHLGI